MHDFMKAAIEQHLADLSDTEWLALVARVRPPGQVIDQMAEQFRRRSDATKQGS